MLRNIEKRVPAGFRQENKKSFRVYLTQAEGLILGTAAQMFTIAGPVIVYGTASSVIYGLIIYIFKLY